LAPKDEAGNFAGMFVRIPLLLMFALGFATVRADDVAARVVILANSDEPESVKLAEYYAAKRSIPEANIIALPMALGEAITWRNFVDTIYNPLQAELVKRGWIDAIAMDLTDDAGRRKYALSGHKISYLTVCKGVPLKVNNDPQMPAEAIPTAANPAFKHNAASVDGELALLAAGNTPLIAFVPNPLFKNDTPSSIQLGQIVKVSRLDGPNFEDARALVDHALTAEKDGLIGRSYVDIGGPHAAGDRWLEATELLLQAMNFDGDVDRAGGSLAPWARMDAPALYFGWYAGALNGPFAEQGFTFPPGAVALHIHSFSAATIRSATQGWVGPLVARGVTATVGNVNEPYLELTHQPQLLLASLARGDRWGDAAAYSVPVYSWQAMAVGDPLYQPFKIPFDQQWAKRDKLPVALRPYVVLRRMRELQNAGKMNEAIWAGLESQKKTFSLAVALAVTELQKSTGDTAGVRQALEGVKRRRNFFLSEAPLAVLVAQRLGEAGDVDGAFDVWMTVMNGRTFSKTVRIQWLKPALAAAHAAKEERQALRWQTELTELTAPPPAPAGASDADKK
jgi:uncharacterized protein (TIGR03790 family)